MLKDKWLLIGTYIVVVLLAAVPLWSAVSSEVLVNVQTVGKAMLAPIRLQGGSDNSTNPTVKIGALVARGNAAAPSWTEGNVVPLSVDLAGNLRTIGGGGSVSAIQGNAGSNAQAWWMRIGDATDGPVDVTAALALKVDGSAVTQPVSGTLNQGGAPWSENITQFGGNAIATGTGASGVGIPRVTISNDSSLAANQSVNVSQINGVTPLMGNGVTGTGSQRVTIASDNTPYAVKVDQTTPGTTNAIAVGQIGSTTVVAGNGVTGAGSQRVTVASDNSAIALWGHGATGAAPPANAVLQGGLGSGATGGLVTAIPVSDTYSVINISTATTTLIVTGVSGRHIRIGALNLVTAAANNVALISGTGATCGTGTAGVAGGTTAASGWNLAANGGLTIGSGLGTVLKTIAAGDSLCLVTSAATQLSGGVSYAIY